MISFRTLESSYEQTRDEFLMSVEEVRLLAYRDSRGIPSIGIGFNLRTQSVLNAVLDAFGFDLSDPVDRDYADQISEAARQNYSSDVALQDALDSIMLDRFNDPTTNAVDKRPDFSFSDSAEAQGVLDDIAQTYEDEIDRWLGGIPQSRERVALFSLAYNSRVGSNGIPTTLGSNLRSAIDDNNRPAGWYEIAFDTNPSGTPDRRGIENRRLQEAAEFGLYSQGGVLGDSNDPNHPSTDDHGAEAITVFRFLDAHKGAMETTLESIYGKTQQQVDNTYINGFYKPAKDELIKTFAPSGNVNSVIVAPDDKGDTITVEGAKTQNTQIKGNVLLLGGTGNDDLTAGSAGRVPGTQYLTTRPRPLSASAQVCRGRGGDGGASPAAQ